MIHEFAHKLDQQSGLADGMPGLGAHPQLNAPTWHEVLNDSLDSFSNAVETIEMATSNNINPESDAAQTWFASLPLDPYVATDAAEFFAVSSEQFFVDLESLIRVFNPSLSRLVRALRNLLPSKHAAKVAMKRLLIVWHLRTGLPDKCPKPWSVAHVASPLN